MTTLRSLVTTTAILFAATGATAQQNTSSLDCDAIAEAIQQTENPEKHAAMMQDAGQPGDCDVTLSQAKTAKPDANDAADEDGIDDQPYVTAGEAEPLAPGGTNDPRAATIEAKMVTLTVAELTGLTVQAADGEIGKVHMISADASGVPEAALVDIGGFLGIGETTVALPLDDLTVSRDGDDMWLATDYTREALEQMPRF